MAVYFIQATDGGPIKIGYTANIGVRLKQLESTYDRPLALLRSIPGGRIEEHDIHSRFAHLRIKRTEQFRPDPELLDFIGRPLFVSAEPFVEAMPSTSMRLVVRGAPEWGEWLAELAEHCRATASELADDALTAYAKQQGFTEKPPRR